MHEIVIFFQKNSPRPHRAEDSPHPAPSWFLATQYPAYPGLNILLRLCSSFTQSANRNTCKVPCVASKSKPSCRFQRGAET